MSPVILILPFIEPKADLFFGIRGGGVTKAIGEPFFVEDNETIRLPAGRISTGKPDPGPTAVHDRQIVFPVNDFSLSPLWPTGFLRKPGLCQAFCDAAHRVAGE